MYKLNFEDIKNNVEANYPNPIANLFRKCRIHKSDDLGGRHKNLIDLFELFIKYITFCVLQTARNIYPDLKSRLPEKGNSFEFLKKPSLGGFVGLIRSLSKLEFSKDQNDLAQRIVEWYNAPHNEYSDFILNLLRDIKDISVSYNTKTPNAEICNALVNYRNKHLAHGANIPSDILTPRLMNLENILTYLLKSSDYLKDYDLIYVEKAEIMKNSVWNYHCSLLKGINDEPIILTQNKKLEINEVYLINNSQRESVDNQLSLKPFVLWLFNTTYKRNEIYIYSEAYKTRLDYLSYQSGSYYSHKELQKDFEELMNIEFDLKSKSIDDSILYLTSEEKAYKIESLYKRVSLFLDQKQFEDALDCLESITEFEKNENIYQEILKVQKLMGENPEQIQLTINKILEINPKAELITQSSNKTNKIEQKQNLNMGESESFNLLYYLTPSKYRNHLILYWIILITIFYSLLSVVFVSASISNWIIISLLMCLESMVMMICLQLGIIFLEKICVPISMQLDKMKLERFNQWYSDEIRKLFGKVILKREKLAIIKSLLFDKNFYMGFLILYMIIRSIVFLSNDSQLGLFYSIFISIGFIPLIYFASLAVRYIVLFTFFILKIGKLSIKPNLSTNSFTGLNSFSSLILFNIFMISMGLVVYFFASLFVFYKPFYIDFIISGFVFIVFGFWSVGLPFAIKESAKGSKRKVALIYFEHLEKAFNDFLENPADDKKLEMFQKIKNNQKVIESLPTWPLTIAQTIIFLLGSNLFLFLILTIYILHRIGIINVYYIFS